MTHPHRIAITAALYLLLAACARRAPEIPVAQPTAPPPTEIIADLARNDGELQSFRSGSGWCIISTPDMKKVVRTRPICFRRPGQLYIRGEDRTLGKKVLELRLNGEDYYLWLPDEREHYARIDGVAYGQLPLVVAPDLIMREMFSSGGWGDVQRAKVVDFDPGKGTAILLIPAREGPERRITVQGPPWLIIEQNLHDQDGRVIAETTRGEYKEIGGVWFPTVIEAVFPGEDTEMTLKLRDVTTNVELPDDLFAITWPPEEHD